MEMVEGRRQFTTFTVSGRLYGIDVQSVQEVTKALAVTKVPIAPNYIHGLINLRGQIATAIGLRELFKLNQEKNDEVMNVICRVEDSVFSLIVDKIGEVIELENQYFEPTPETVSEEVSDYMEGVYKLPGEIMSVLSVQKFLKILKD